MAFDGIEFKGPGGVNVAAILALADQVERSTSFDMSTIEHSCGTPACIYGHYRTVVDVANSEAAGVRLGLTLQQTADLFQMPMYDTKNGGLVSVSRVDGVFVTDPLHGAACLRNLAATGEVDWLGTKPASTSPKA